MGQWPDWGALRKNDRRGLGDTKNRQAFPGILLRGIREIRLYLEKNVRTNRLYFIGWEKNLKMGHIIARLYADRNNQVQRRACGKQGRIAGEMLSWQE